MNKNKQLKYLSNTVLKYIDWLVDKADFKKLYTFLTTQRYVRCVNAFNEWAFKLYSIMKDDPDDTQSLAKICVEMSKVLHYIKRKQLEYNAMKAHEWWHSHHHGT